MASRISKTWLIRVTLIIAVLALVGGALSCSSPTPSDPTPDPPDTEPGLPNPTPQPHKAPDFTLPTMTGAQITLSEMEGTPVVLVFWAISCVYCRTELQRLEAIAQQNEGKIRIIAINTGESAVRVQKFFGDYEPTMIVALDLNREVFVNYCQKYNNPRGYIPITFFIDTEGVIKQVKLGAFTSDAELWDSLRSIFKTTAP
jgi:peroxiredoxin